MTFLDAPALAAAFADFVSALEAPEAGGALHDALHPDAWVLVNAEPVRAGSFSREEFAGVVRISWELFATHHPGEPRRPRLAPPALSDVTLEGGDRLVAWWRSTEADGRPLIIATGHRRHGDAWKLDWLTLAESPADWGYDMGRAQALADFPYAAASLDLVPRSWLDLAYFRLYGHEKPALEVLPDARFDCHMSTTCCRIDYRIVAGAGAQAFVDAVPWETLHPPLAGTRLEPDVSGGLLIKPAGEDCRFLDADRHCRLHKAFGRPVFEPCTAFPFRFARTPEGVAVSASPMCSSVRQSLGRPLAERAADLHGRLAITGYRLLPAAGPYALAPGAEVAWETFKAVERSVLAPLDRRELSLRRRLWIAVQALESAIAGGPSHEPAWETSPFPTPDDEDTATALKLVDGFATLIQLDEATSAPQTLLPADPAYDEQMRVLLKNLIFSKGFSQGASLRVALNMAILASLWAERLRAPGGPVPEPLRERFAMRIFHRGFEKTLLGPEAGPVGQLLGEPWFGLVLLAVAEDQAATAGVC